MCRQDDACLLQAGYLQLHRGEAAIWQMQTCRAQAGALAQPSPGRTQPGACRSLLHGAEEDVIP